MDSRLLGAFGEQNAARYLRQQGYEIFSGNFTSSIGEIDIIAFKDNIISFVEVKTRTEGAMYDPADAVDFKKQENIRSTASSYINKYNIEYSYRYDIVEVIVDKNSKIKSINHIKNAF